MADKIIKQILAINKPCGPTSHDIINALRRITGVKKIGHAGTLDPLAQGVLVVAIGRENTKKISQIVKSEKEYLANIKFGEYSSTDDNEGEKTKVNWLNQPTKSHIVKVLDKFVGEIMQQPPAYSAIKIKGQCAYALARKGQEIKLKPRKVYIKKIELLGYKWPELKLKVICGPGVYIRSLVRDIGANLEVGAYLLALQRTRVGNFNLDQALTVEEFAHDF